jgi:organic radical activating enzyme
MPKYFLHHFEFYITNVCNLDCSDCRSFNNFNFKGHYKFDPKNYEQWAEKVDIGSFEIIGGEPTLHPNLLEWMEGLRKLWPNCEANLITNGTRLSKVRGLHEAAAKYKYNIKLSMHARDLRDLITDEIFNAFGDCKVLPLEKSAKGDFINIINLETSLGVKIQCQNSENFQISPFKNANFEFFNSDPEEAHKNCLIRECFHMVDNQLYKCALVATGKKFLEQQQLSVPNVLNSYKPILAENVNSQAVLDQLKLPIPQCSLCHHNNPVVPLRSKLKKSKIFKIQSPSGAK